MKDIKVIFFGTPEFSVPLLEELIKNFNVIMVVTQPDKMVGRKKVLTPSLIKQIAINNNIEVFTPNKIRLDYEKIINKQPDIIITCAYGQIVPKEILECPKYGCINVHASLLPKYRGGAPIQRSIINGDEKTGITIMYMNEGMDTGDMISKEEVLIDFNDTYDTLNDKLSNVGVELLIKTLPSIFEGNNNRNKQDENDASYAKIITREDEYIDFNKTSLEIYNKIRGLSSNPGAYALLDGKVVKIYNSRIEHNINTRKIPGEIVRIYNDGIGIATFDSEIIITDIKMEGKNRILVKDYLNGMDKNKLIGKVFNK